MLEFTRPENPINQNEVCSNYMQFESPGSVDRLVGENVGRAVGALVGATVGARVGLAVGLHIHQFFGGQHSEGPTSLVRMYAMSRREHCQPISVAKRSKSSPTKDTLDYGHLGASRWRPPCRVPVIGSMKSTSDRDLMTILMI